ncbi:hypothetical protein Hanom_Chr09g00781131 [Helianthus anomalus]
MGNLAKVEGVKGLKSLSLFSSYFKVFAACSLSFCLLTILLCSSSTEDGFERVLELVGGLFSLSLLV